MSETMAATDEQIEQCEFFTKSTCLMPWRTRAEAGRALIARIEQDAEQLAKLEIDLDEADTDIRTLEAEAATLRAERNRMASLLRQAIGPIHAALGADRNYRGSSDHPYVRLALDIYEALGSGGTATGDGADGEVAERDLKWLDRMDKALDTTTPAPSGAKESDDDE